MDRYLKFDHEFIGREAVEAEQARGPKRRLVMFEVDVDEDEPADVIGDEPVGMVGGDGDDTASSAGSRSAATPTTTGCRWRGVRSDRARRRIAGLRDRDHRQAPPGAHLRRSRQSTPPDSECAPERTEIAMARLVDVDHRVELLDAVVGYLADTGWRTCRCARWHTARRQRQRPRPPFRIEGRPDRGRPAPSGRRSSRTSSPSGWSVAGYLVAGRSLAKRGGDGSPPSPQNLARGATRHRGRGAGCDGDPDYRARCAAIRSASGGRTSSSASWTRASPAVDGDDRSVVGEGDVHGSRGRPAGDRRTPPPRPGRWRPASHASNANVHPSDLDVTRSVSELGDVRRRHSGCRNPRMVRGL